MTPGLTIIAARGIRIRHLREDDIPRWMAANRVDQGTAEAMYAAECAKPDGPPTGIGKQFSVETRAGIWVGFTGFMAEPDGDATGYFYIDPAAPGKDLREALVRNVLDVIFRECRARRCIVNYHDWDAAARRLYGRIRFHEVIRSRIPDTELTSADRERVPDRPVFAVILELLREEYARG